MLNCRYIIVLLALFISSLTQARAQIVSPERDQVLDVDSVKKAFDDAPYFGLYKDNYFIFGPAIGMKPTKYNTNVKFQISISQRLTKRTLPFGSYLYLFYTQKCFWDVLRKSFPMTDLNFNPGIGLTKPLFVKDRFIGKVSLILEHESNGKAEEDSRSWNRISFAGNILIDPTMMVHGKIWIPIVDGENNRDLLDYYGLYQFGITYMTPTKRFGGSIILTKRKGWNPFNFNTVLELSYKLFNNENQYLFMQYYNGYGEGLLDYKTFKSQLRVGICIKPQFFSEY
ncbi:MAG: phospholipase A [Muribaculum sp.]|nr:phospholipase A [Muribaculum sp.]